MMPVPRYLRFVGLSLLLLFWFGRSAVGQTETATVSGLVTDRSAAAVSGAEVRLQSVERGTVTNTTTNGAGIYVFPNVQPGQYQISIQKQGFKQVDLLGLIVNVQDHIEQNFRLEVGSVTESVTVEAGALTINTTDATVSTVVDRQFAENLPMNGRSFQTLIELTPGVVPVSGGSSGVDSGQFSINGQRGTSNYWTVDGVSANVGSSTAFGGEMIAGAIGTSSVLGGTNSLVSVDALQEFRIQTSTYAPEFGRTPGGQISIVTRSGTNQFHGTLFDYLRNDIFDANNWFNTSVTPALRKAEERQNDFGGTFAGPILKDRAFFFFSYEGLRLRLPQTALTTVPDVNARNSAVMAMQPYLNAYPLPNGTDNAATGAAQFNASFSNPASLDAYAIRIDHRVKEKLNIFGRYNYSPSSVSQRGVTPFALSTTDSAEVTTQTLTIGSNWVISPHATTELRFNYSRTNASSHFSLDDFGGAVALTSLGFPSPYTTQNASLLLGNFFLTNGSLIDGASVQNLQRQFNVVANATLQKGTHTLKAGVDYRRLSPEFAPFLYRQTAFFFNAASLESGKPFGHLLNSLAGAAFLFRNIGVFAQDTWRVVPRLTFTYGLRWDTDFAPSSLSGPPIPAASGFNLGDLSQLALAPTGTPPFKTTYANFAPRVAAAYQLSQSAKWTTVARGGFGVFYDLATSEAANLILRGGYPFSRATPFTPGGTFPLSPAAAAPPPIMPPSAQSPGTIAVFNPGLKLPYTLQWNVAIEQQLGSDRQSLSGTYVGSVGRRLLQTLEVNSPSPTINTASLEINSATSDYHALQLQFQRRLSGGLQILSSYTFAHSIDSASAGNVSNSSNVPSSPINQNANRASSDFDVRHSFSVGATYAVPALKANALIKTVTGGWSLQSIIQAHTAPPLTIIDGNFSQLTNGLTPDIRPDVVQGIPLYLYGSKYPGGKAINNTPGAVSGGCADGSQSIGPFCPPPVDANGNALRQGNSSRNFLRGFGLFQWDFGIHRDFAIRESLHLQFRAEMFNILNHPNFGPPVADLSQPNFGVSTQMLGQYLGAAGLGAGAFNPLYQIGGPRSMQFALKLSF
jgi:hypothetical protein